MNRKPKLAQPHDIAHRIGADAHQIQLELSKLNPGMGMVDKLLWDIRHGSVAIQGAYRRREIISDE